MHTSAICTHIFGSCSLSPSAYKQQCNWMRQWVTHISIQSQHISVSGHPSLPRVGRLIYGTPGTTETIVNCCRRVSFVREAAAAAEKEDEIAVGMNEMPVDGFDLLLGMTSDELSQYVAVHCTLMSRLRLKSLMRSCALASRQLQMLTRMGDEQWGHWRDWQTIAGSNQHRSRCPLHCCVSILHLRIGLEMAGCDSYERLYGLIDQVHEIANKRPLQKTMTDFYARN